MSEGTLPSRKFPVALTLIVAFLAGSLVLQTVAMDMDKNEGENVTYSVEDADVEVMVGEMYFEQQDSSLPVDELEAEVGDIIYFYNEGEIPHTVTIKEFGLDKYLEPGEEVFLKVERTADGTKVNCRLHSSHEGKLTVTE